MQFACFPTHQLHEHCYNAFVKSCDDRNVVKLCPTCRVPIDVNAVVKKHLTVEKPSQMNVDEVFELEELPVPESPAPAAANDPALLVGPPAGAPPMVIPPSEEPVRRVGTVHIDAPEPVAVQGDDDLPVPDEE